MAVLDSAYLDAIGLDHITLAQETAPGAQGSVEGLNEAKLAACEGLSREVNLRNRDRLVAVMEGEAGVVRPATVQVLECYAIAETVQR